jgi:hypothetical protein
MTTSQKYTHDDESTVETALTTESSRMASTSTVDKRKIRFSLESNQVFHITHINDMSQHDIHESWYTEGEHKAIQNQMHWTIYQIDCGFKVTESNTLTVRGLEWRTHPGAHCHEHSKLMARHAVLNEQYRQVLNEEQDDELVADAYLNASIDCCHEAYWMGLKDEAAIKKEPKEIIMTEHQTYVKHDDRPKTIPAGTTASSSMASTVNKLNIRFSLESNQVFPITHINDMRQHDIHETWYTEEESNNIQNGIYWALRQIGSGDNVTESETFTARGIECRTHQGNLRRNHNRNMATTAVLNEQYRQFLKGERDDELVADASRRTSSHCHCEAYWMGFKDEAAIKKLKKSSRTENRKYVEDKVESTAIKKKLKRLSKTEDRKNAKLDEDESAPASSLLQIIIFRLVRERKIRLAQ